MAMIGVQDIRNGTAFLLEGQPWLGLSYDHIKMGRGSATIKIKMRNLVTGATVEKSFINSAMVDEIELVHTPMQYLYADDTGYVFMNQATFEQAAIPEALLGDQTAFLKEGVVVDVLTWDDRPMSVELPAKMEFTITETDPGIKGNSAANFYKPAVLDNGLSIKVPLFIEAGERIIVDTRQRAYVERVR